MKDFFVGVATLAIAVGAIFWAGEKRELFEMASRKNKAEKQKQAQAQEAEA